MIPAFVLTQHFLALAPIALVALFIVLFLALRRSR